MKQKIKKIGIICTMLVLVLLLGVAVWLINRNNVEESVQTAKNELGVEWYDENGTEFTINTIEQFYEFAELSMYYDFAGQTIYLGADLVDNEGNAADWADKRPENLWESIYGFAGTFDGQGHTISGIYCTGYLYFANILRVEGMDYVTAGLFRSTREECVIKNFKLVNSYFESDLNYGVGSISSNGGGTFDSIYSDAIIVSQKNYIGGIIGLGTEDTTITNCWFDGSIDVVGGYARFTGGMAGRFTGKIECKVEHCLVSATMTNDLYERGVNMGGLIGTTVESNVTVSDCLVSGRLYNDWRIVGSVMGNVATDSTVTMSDVFTTKDAFSKTIGYVEGGNLQGTPVAFDRERITGYGGYQWTTLDFENYWTVVEDGTPILQTFATENLSLEGVAKMVDTSWYNEEADSYILTDFSDFFGFALLSNTTNFEGKTVLLGADITINEGNAKNWAKTAPEYDWIRIGSGDYPFAGTFDGQMHTISGIYLKTDETLSGLFGMTAETATIKNFSLKNSYFESSAASFGSIAGRGLGTYETIYSNAIVASSNGNVGGMVGQVAGATFDVKLTMNNCWFDGSVRTTANNTSCKKVGGLIGFVVGNAEVSNCLNTGTVDASILTCTNSETSTNVQPYVGGLIGQIHSKAKAKLSYCLNVGDVKYSKEATHSYGSVIGTASGTAELAHVYATTESCKKTATGYLKGQVMTYDEEKLVGYGGYEWTTLNFQKYWAVVLSDTPILKSFAKRIPSLNGIARKIDTSWYNEKANEYVLYDAADLYGFALLSYTNNFAGKTVKLGADITINTGNAVEWGTTAPENEWMAISSLALPFAGTFDGQMHTISGVYMKSDTSYTGFFSTTAEEAVIKNFSLKNSYLESSAASFGSIAGRGIGTYDTIYSDAIVVSSNGNVGGFIGMVTGETVDMKLTMNNCWFDGSVIMTENDVTCRRSGGFLGFVIVKADLINCLNTGTIDASVYTCKNSETSKHVQPYVGGFIGQIHSKGNVTISGCLNVGEVKHSEAATSSYGSVIGTSSGKAKISNTYTTKESCVRVAEGKLTGSPISYKEARLLSYGGYQWTTLDFDNYWAVALDDTPILKSFATTIPELNVARMVDISWYDENQDTYILDEADELYGFAVLSSVTNFKGKTVKLGDDITINEGDAADWAETAPKYEWFSIGDASSETRRFAGTFDGQMHSVKGVYMNADSKYAGFFGGTASTAVIKNFRLENSYFYSTEQQVGSIVGNAQGTLDTVYSNAIVESISSYAGGMVGATSSVVGVTMKNCWFDGLLTNNTTVTNYYGGLIGRIHNTSTFTDCLNTGTISLTQSRYPNVGALIGFVNQTEGTKPSTISNSVNLGTLVLHDSPRQNFGAIVGSMKSEITVDNCHTITQSNVPVVDATTADKATVTDSGVAGTLDSVKGYGALSGMANLFATKTDTIRFESSWVARQGKIPMLKCFADVADEVLTVDVGWYKASDSEYEISETDEFYGFAWLSKLDEVDGFKDKTIKLTEDVSTQNEGEAAGWETNAPKYGWISIGTIDLPFNGTFDGMNHEISGIYLKASSSYQGMFVATGADAEIKNFYLKNSYFETTTTDSRGGQLGSIVGNAQGTFKTIYSDAIVKGYCNRVGGLIGATSTSGGVTMSDCWFAGSATINSAASYLGGLIGNVTADSNITNCLNTGEVYHKYKVSTNGAGGFVGWVGSSITLDILYSVNTSNVKYTGGKYYGLFVGKADGTVNATYSHSINYSGKNQVGNNSTGTNPYSTCTRQNAASVASIKAITTAKVKELFTAEAAKGYWAITPDSLPVLSSLAKKAGVKAQAVDTSWYDASKTEFTLMDSGDLYGLAVLSKNYTFEDKTIKLGVDIEINSGNAADWAITAPDFGWLSIGGANTGENRFNGKFYGQGHTISGIYMNTSSAYQGLFGATGTKAEIKDFYLINSYFYSSNEQLGSIVGNAMGEFNNIYSDANLESAANYVGGMIGSTSSSGGVTMSECWFDGRVANVTTAASYYGGLVGRIFKSSTISNCLNTGEINCVLANGPSVGGIVGYAQQSVSLSLCLNMGTIGYKSTATNYGLLVGNPNGSKASIVNSYSTSQTGVNLAYGKENSTYSGCDVVGSKAEINASNAQEKMPALFNQSLTTSWTVATYGLPVLDAFKNVVPKH